MAEKRGDDGKDATRGKIDPEKLMASIEDTTLPMSPEESRERIAKLDAIVTFEKVLTKSDTNNNGRFVIPKAIAEAHFPPVEDPNGSMIPLVDVFGEEQLYKFRYWTNIKGRMYLIEGTRKLQKKFRLEIGDVLMFAKDTTGTIYVCGRMGTSHDKTRKPPVRKGKGSQEESASPSEVNDASSEAQRILDTRVPTRVLNSVEHALSNSYSYWNGVSYPARSDGVFRAVPMNFEKVSQDVAPMFGLWCATVDLNGEQYQAFFDSEDAARAALLSSMQE